MYKPLDGSGQDQNAQLDAQPNPRGKDPVGPLKITPSLGGDARGSNNPKVDRNAIDSQSQFRQKDPVRPLNIAPQAPPPTRKPDNSNGPPAKGNDANAKDPVGPLRIAPPNR
jgi:hypothetical protein